MADRPNLFELLELDPEIDKAAIVKRIVEKRKEWTQERSKNTSKKRSDEAKRKLEALEELQKLLHDPEHGPDWLRTEAANARRLRQEARLIRERELAEKIELLKASSLCSPEQLEKLVRQFDGFLTEAEIRAQLTAAGIRVGEAPGSKAPRERIDPVLAADIRRNLDVLGLSSLYEYLERPSTESPSALCARADEIYKENRRLGLTDTRTTARDALAGLAKTVLRNEEEKRKYDNHRLLEIFESLKDHLDLAGVDGVLTAQKVETLIRLATQRGIPLKEAHELLEEHAARQGWRVEKSSAAPAPGTTSPNESPTASEKTDGAEPPAPARLIVRPIAGGLRLSWEPVRIPGDVRYRVLRKQGSVPWDEGDGEMIASTADAQADDTTVTPGVPWYYAVFTLRSGLASTVPAHSGPHLVSTAAAGAAGTAAPEPSRKLGGLPVRRMAAAAALLLALGGGGAAVVYWPAPAKLLASLLPAAAPSPQQKSPAAPNPGPPGGAGGQAPGGQTVPPQSPNQVNPVNTNPANQQVAAGAFPLPPAPPPLANTNPGQITGSSGQGGQTGHVLGQQSSRPAPAVVPILPRPALALPEIPEITVLAVGDPLLATGVEDELERALRGEGFTVASGLASLDGFRQHRTDKPSVSQVFSALQGEGVHILVLARVDLLAERELSYYGRKDVASTSRLRIDAYLMDGRRSLGNWSDQIEYTVVNAATEGEAAARRAASDLSATIHDGWSAHRGTGSTP